MIVKQKKVYVGVAPTELAQVLKDLHVDLRDVKHSQPIAIPQLDGNFNIEVVLSEKPSPTGIGTVPNSPRY